MLYMAGPVAFKDGSVFAPGEGGKQVFMVYERLQKVLAMHGATVKNVVRENAFVTDWEEYFKGAPIRKKAYADAGADFPAAKGVEVKSLAEQGIIYEIEFIVYFEK